MFRLIVLIAAIVLVLPTDAAQQARLKERASAGAAWALTFCDRNGATCKAAGEYWVVAKAKAAFAAQMVGEIVSERMAAGAQTASHERPAEQPPPRSQAGGTLTADDLRPVWRARAGKAGL